MPNPMVNTYGKNAAHAERDAASLIHDILEWSLSSGEFYERVLAREYDHPQMVVVAARRIQKRLLPQ